MELVMDCKNNTFTMKPPTHQDNYITGSGSIGNGELKYTLYSEGSVHATGFIRP